MPAKAARRATRKTTVRGGRMVRVLTPDERSADIKAFGREIRKSKESAISFLKNAGILDETGELAEPYRS